MYTIGVELNATQIIGAFINRDGSMQHVTTLPTFAEKGEAVVLKNLYRVLISLLRQNRSVHAIGIAMIKEMNTFITRWDSESFKRVIEERFSMPVCIVTNLHAAAVGEGWKGAGRDVDLFVYITLGANIDGVIVQKNKIENQINQYGDDLGHLILHPGGRTCSCGQQGCWQAYASMITLDQYARELPIYLSDNISVTWKTLVELAHKGQVDARIALLRFYEDVAYGLISLQNILNPNCFIIAGDLVVKHGSWQQELDSKVLSLTSKSLQLKTEKLGQNAILIGAGKIAMDTLPLTAKLLK